MKREVKKIIAAIKAKNETVVHDGLSCLALDVKNGVLLWCEITEWLAIRIDEKYYSFSENKNCVRQRNIPIYKKGKEYFTPEQLEEILNQITG